MGAFDYTTNGVTMPVQSCMIPWSGQPADMTVFDFNSSPIANAMKNSLVLWDLEIS